MHEGQPPARQVAELHVEILRPIACNVIPDGRGDSFKMNHMVSPQNGMDVAPYCEGFHGNLHHRRESLVWKLDQAGEVQTDHIVQADQDREKRVQTVHRLVLVNSKKSDYRQPGGRVNPRGKLTEEGVKTPDGVLFCR